MPAKDFRLPSAELKNTRGFNRRSSQFFTVRFRPNQVSHPRFAVVVGSKVDKAAVHRNKMKRRVREFLRLLPGGQDIVVTVAPAVRDLPRARFLQELEKLLP